MLMAVALALWMQPGPVLDNAYARVTKNSLSCARAEQKCGHRMVLALSNVQFRGKTLGRGDLVAFKDTESYTAPTGGDFVEVVLKASRPAVLSPPTMIPPDKNSIVHDSAEFFVFEEKLLPGDLRERHSHSQRVVIVLNDTRLQQWPDGQPELFKQQIPDDIKFNEPVIHKVKNVGSKPLRNIVIEFKPERRKTSSQ